MVFFLLCYCAVVSLSLEERYYIETALKKGDSQNMIAKALNRSRSIKLLVCANMGNPIL